MELALEGKDGRPMTEREYLLKYGTNPKKWPDDKRPHCPDCKALVNRYATDDALAEIKFVSHAEITGSKPPNKVGWHHQAKSAGLDCPQDFSKDQRFSHLASLRYNHDLQASNEQLLSRPDIAEANNRVVKKFFHILLEREPKAEEIAQAEKDVRRKFTGMEIAREMPELFPVYVVLSLRPQVSEGKTSYGKPRKVVFRPGSTQTLMLTDSRGRPYQQKIPSGITVHTVIRPEGGSYEYIPQKKPVSTIEVTKESLRRLAIKDYSASAMDGAIHAVTKDDDKTLRLFGVTQQELANAPPPVAAPPAAPAPAPYKPWMRDGPRPPIPPEILRQTQSSSITEPKDSAAAKPVVAATPVAVTTAPITTVPVVAPVTPQTNAPKEEFQLVPPDSAQPTKVKTEAPKPTKKKTVGKRPQQDSLDI